VGSGIRRRKARRVSRLAFVVPVHGRHDLAAICLRQLRRTCDELAGAGVDASAILITDRENLLELAHRLGAGLLGFGTYERDNRFLSRKFNDGIQCALDPKISPRPADYVVPFGSDDWADWRLFADLPDDHTVYGFQRMSFVREDGREMMTAHLNYPGGAGIRIFPRALMAELGYRPGDEDRSRGCDTSILTNLQRHLGHRMRIEHRHLHDRQIVDWKSRGEQLNGYLEIGRLRRGADYVDPWAELAEHYPAEALEEMRAHYGVAEAVAA
jgi:hypothetical protein